MHTYNPKRAVVTGMGIVTAIGHSITTFRQGLFAGVCGIRPVSLFDTTGFPCQNAAQVAAKDLDTALVTRNLRRASRCDILGLAAAEEAFLSAGIHLDRCQRDNIGVVMGGGAGGMRSWEEYRRTQWLGQRRPRPSLLLPAASCTLTDLIAARYRLTGARATISTACSSSSTAIGYASDLITSGTHDIVVTGGSEALSELTFAGFNALRAMDPEYCRPFDKHRKGLSLGEGAAVLILEDLRHAMGRNATIYAKVFGYAINADAYHMTTPDPAAKGMAKVMAKALDAAGVNAEDIDYINAHGTATKMNDHTETQAIKDVFGEGKARRLAVSSTKSMVGHCLGAAGAVEAVATILALYHQVLPPTVHLDEPDPDCDLDYVPNHHRTKKIRFALSNSFAFGGNNTAVVFGNADADG
jgi:3-oxoacyl-[acyl-carrier-protein] synthase II